MQIDVEERAGSDVVDDRQGHDEPGLSGKAVAAVLLLAVFTILIIWRAHRLELTLEGDSEQPQLVDKPAPKFSAATLDGHTVSLADFRGQKNIVVAFWASWCAPCRLEMPDLVKFYQRHHTDSSDFEILAVSIDHEPKDAEEYAAGQKLRFPVLLDSHEQMADDYGVYSIPTMFVIDKNGKIVYGHSGYNEAMEYRLASELGIKEDAHGGGTE